jgi:hypothetical protein
MLARQQEMARQMHRRVDLQYCIGVTAYARGAAEPPAVTSKYKLTKIRIKNDQTAVRKIQREAKKFSNQKRTLRGRQVNRHERARERQGETQILVFLRKNEKRAMRCQRERFSDKHCCAWATRENEN